VATTAYRIAQEALTNVARHAGARTVSVTLTAAEGRLHLSVTDDGRGFDPEAASEGDGLGLAGMRERAALVGGTLGVRSTPGEGVDVVFEMRLT
jgi:signal transduction histidine kinase